MAQSRRRPDSFTSTGSTDQSVWLAAQAGARIVHESRRGYGAALRRGFEAATGEWLVMGDCDDTYDFADLNEHLASALS